MAEGVAQYGGAHEEKVVEELPEGGEVAKGDIRTDESGLRALIMADTVPPELLVGTAVYPSTYVRRW